MRPALKNLGQQRIYLWNRCCWGSGCISLESRASWVIYVDESWYMRVYVYVCAMRPTFLSFSVHERVTR